MTPSGIEPATFRFVAQHFNHCATAVPLAPCISINYVILTYFPSNCTHLKNFPFEITVALDDRCSTTLGHRAYLTVSLADTLTSKLLITPADS